MATENKNLSTYDKATLPQVKGKSVGIITSQWNGMITENMRKGVRVVQKHVRDRLKPVERVGAWEVQPGQVDQVLFSMR